MNLPKTQEKIRFYLKKGNIQISKSSTHTAKKLRRCSFNDMHILFFNMVFIKDKNNFKSSFHFRGHFLEILFHLEMVLQVKSNK